MQSKYLIEMERAGAVTFDLPSKGEVIIPLVILLGLVPRFGHILGLELEILCDVPYRLMVDTKRDKITSQVNTLLGTCPTPEADWMHIAPEKRYVSGIIATPEKKLSICVVDYDIMNTEICMIVNGADSKIGILKMTFEGVV